MHTEFLDIPVWDDTEIREALGETVGQREKLHHWPLSYVERVDLADRSVVIKYSKLSLENEFYSSAESPFLVKPVFMTDIGDTSVTVLPFISGHEPDESELVSAIELIPTISCEKIWADASSHERFMELMNEAAKILTKHDPSASPAAFLEKCKSLEGFFTPDSVGFVHGDLKRDNIIVDAGRTFIIDWQRPMLAPFIIDRVTCGFEKSPDAVSLAKAFEAYWLLYAFDRCLYKLPHVINWAKKNISGMLDQSVV